jgi:ATP-binding cassette, subfamily C, bacterial CydC
MKMFIIKHIIKPFAKRWFNGFLLLLFWTVAFIALPAISGWFLASCSLAFIAANSAFMYMVPSSIIRLLTLMRTATRYFERLESHKTTLDAQRSLQLKIFLSVAHLPFFKKQAKSNSAILENSTHGIDLILNHILLWLLPFSVLTVSLVFYFFFLNIFSTVVAIEFIISSAVLLFLIPQYLFLKNRKLYKELKTQREENNEALIETFKGRIEISKYNLEQKATSQQVKKMMVIEQLETRLFTNSFSLQLLVGLGFSSIALLTLWNSANNGINAATAIGIFFGIMAQAELSEMLFSGKSEKSSVKHQINDLDSILRQEQHIDKTPKSISELTSLSICNVRATIPETTVFTNETTIELKKGDWIALYGETGKGKTTFLNSLFYPEYRQSGLLQWNDEATLSQLPIPECIYVSQKAYLLTGTLRENFEGYADKDIEQVLETVDLSSWYLQLPNGLDSWLGENGETLSGGQRKKLLLAQALLKKPQLLVVDEPTAGISTGNAIAIFQEIKRQYPNMAILMATHMKEFEKKVDRVIHI